ncbi:MAG: MAPEG family protein [Pseudomonadales bacterium]|nr:MAPEG family protein [Pseudomonadales bacterium]
MDTVNLVVLTALIEYIAFILVVGATRGKYGVTAPAITGNIQWERLYRIQVNTAEQLVLFIPAIYGFAYYVSKPWAAGIGAVFLVGRIVYFFGYRKAGDKRLIGAILSAWPSYILVVGALTGLVAGLI